MHKSFILIFICSGINNNNSTKIIKSQNEVSLCKCRTHCLRQYLPLCEHLSRLTQTTTPLPLPPLAHLCATHRAALVLTPTVQANQRQHQIVLTAPQKLSFPLRRGSFHNNRPKVRMAERRVAPSTKNLHFTWRINPLLDAVLWFKCRTGFDLPVSFL